MESTQSVSLPVLDLSTLKFATGNFAERNKLGEGGFGAVYKVHIILYLGPIQKSSLGWTIVIQLLSVLGAEEEKNTPTLLLK